MSVKVHLPTLKSILDAKIVTVKSRSIEKAKNYAAKFGSETFYVSEEELFKDPKIEAESSSIRFWGDCEKY